MKKIAIYQTNMNIGGISIGLQNLLKSGVLNNCDVDVYLFSDKHIVEGFPANIHFIFLEPFGYINRFVPYKYLYKKADIKVTKQYDFAIDFSSYSNECSIYSLKTIAKKHIMWIHNDVDIKYKNEWKYRVLWKFFCYKFNLYDEFVAVSEGAKKAFIKKTGIKDKTIIVVPNFLNVNDILEKSHEDKEEIIIDESKINLLTIAYLNKQKGIDLLIKEMNSVVARRKDVKLYIMGDGPKYSTYRKMVSRYNLEDYIEFMGQKKNPYAILKQMDAFVLNSRYEGQGIVLMEAKVLGIPLIFPKHLEKYTYKLCGTDDIVDKIVRLKKEKHEIDYLYEYIEYIKKQINMLLN